jgi:CdiI immunity protein
MITSSSALGQFLGSYFHPDWNLDDARTELVVDRFVKASYTNDVALVALQLERFLMQIESLSDQDLEREMFSLGAYYRCTAERRTAREWLRAVLAQLKQSAQDPAVEP